MKAKALMAPIERFLAALTGSVAREAAAVLPVAGFIHTYLEEDRRFTAAEYPDHPNGGVWSGSTTPWLADILTIPPTWSWTPADLALVAARNLQIKAENAYIQKNVPGQTYEGPSAAQILQQRYTKGMWDGSVFPASQVSTLVSNWIDDDAEFARQRLGGANPYVIAKHAKQRGSEPALRAWLSRSAGAHDREALAAQLAAALDAGELFVCDYRPILGGVAAKKYVRAGRRFAVPVVYFTLQTVSGRRALVPVAIQIDAPGDGYVFTPADDANAWLLAKIWAASADAQVWFSGTHIFRTHTVGAIFGIAALSLIQTDRLSRSHPMVALAYPHLEKVFDINHPIYDAKAYDRGGHSFGIYQRGTDEAPGFTDTWLPTGRIGIFQIISDLWDAYDFDAQAFDVDLAARGADAEGLPISFPFRDDGAVWWGAIQAFVEQIVEASYADDAAVAADAELGAWMARVQEAFNHDGKARFAWRASRADLARIFTNLIFLCTAQHTAVNDAQFDQFAFLPNGAWAMTAPPPTGPGVTDAALLASLPDPQAQSDGTYAAPIQTQIDFTMAGTSPVRDAAAGNGTLESLHARYRYPEGSPQHAAVARFHDAIWGGPGSVQARIAENQDARIAASPIRPAPSSVAYYYLDARPHPERHVSAPVMSCIQI